MSSNTNSTKAPGIPTKPSDQKPRPETDDSKSLLLDDLFDLIHRATHHDGNGTSLYNIPDNKWLHNKTRKLSMSILLNDDYEGGGFKFVDDIDNPIGIGGNGTKGTVIVFPSYHSHSVKKVTKGIRYSLVVWFLGKGFK